MRIFGLGRANSGLASTRGALAGFGLRALAVTFLVSGSVVAQQSTPAGDADHEMMRQLLARVGALEAEVKELKAKEARATPVARPPGPPAPEAVLPKTSNTGQESSPLKTAAPASPSVPEEQEKPEVVPSGPSLAIRGFGDFGFHVTDQRGETNSFSLNQFDLFLKSRLSDTFSVTSDVILDAFPNNAFRVDVERIVLQYAPSDYFNLSVGRFLTGIGYYNVTYQHANFLQTTIDRPFIFTFDDHGGLLPTHSMGFTAEGLIPSGGLGLHYIAEVSNGRRSRSPSEEPVQSFVDENNRKAFNFGFYTRPDRLQGFRAGFSIYHDRLTPEGQSKIGENIFAVHVVYVKPNFEFLNEGFLIRHSPVGRNTVFTTPAFYTQFSRRFFGRYRPFFRYEYTNVPVGEPFFGEVGRRNGPTAGIRIDLNDSATLKLEYDRLARRSANTSNKLSLHFAFAF